jgi:hypothetical protein
MVSRMMRFICVICAFAVLATCSSSSIAAPIEVGMGINTAGVYIEWSDGFIAEFDINFGQTTLDTTTGADLMLTLDSELSDFTLAYTNWGTETQPDLFINSLAYQEHVNGGFGGGENWWHYWIKDAGSEWDSPMYGMSNRTIHDGDMDGWIYGRATAPIPEPATIVLLTLGGIALVRKKS